MRSSSKPAFGWRRAVRTAGLLAALLSLLISAWEISAPWRYLVEPPPRELLALDGVHLWDAEASQFSAPLQLRIRNGRVEAILPAQAAAPADYRLLDLRDHWVTPGLIDMHVHIHDRRDLMLNLAAGVTTVRNMRGAPKHLRWKKQLHASDWLGSRLISSSPVLDGPEYAHLLQKVVTRPEQGRELVRRYHARGYDLIKAYGYLDADVFAAIVNEANRLGMPVAKHGPAPVEGSDINSLRGLQSLEHMEDVYQGYLNYKLDEEQLSVVAEQLRELGVPVVATLASYEHLTRLSVEGSSYHDSLRVDRIDPLMRLIEQAFSVDRWLTASEQQAAHNLAVNAFLKKATGVFRDAGVPLALGSDAGTNHQIAGQSTWEEFMLLQEAGLSFGETLEAATETAAEALGLGELGCLRPGCIADLVVYARDPSRLSVPQTPSMPSMPSAQASGPGSTTVLPDPAAVVSGGRWLNADLLARLREQASNRSDYFWSTLEFAESIMRRKLDP
ncbi:MAG: hypothetical protein Cons2KO_00930 [Congregibacter sp.]